MKYNKYLDELLGQKSKIKALRYLVKFSDGVGIRELSRRIKITEPNLSKVLKELAKQGALTSNKYGTSLVFRLNYGHYLVDKVIIPLFKREQSGIDELARFIHGRVKTVFISMIIFGSIARGDEEPRSDLDIAFIVSSAGIAKKLEKELMDISIKTVEKFGNQISPYIIQKDDFIKKLSAGDNLARNIAKDGKVLKGRMISEIL